MRRRTILATIGAVTSGVGGGCLELTRTDSSDPNQATAETDDGIAEGTWPQVAYDARNTRHTPDARGPRNGADVAWTALGDRPVYPPVVDDALYLTEAWTDGAALAVAGNGEIQWAIDDLPPMRWAPALHGDRLLVVTRETGNVVRLHALDTATGDQAWVREDGITASSGERPPTGPTVRDGSVYLGSNRGVIACEASTGDLEWTAVLGEHVVETDNGPTWRTDWATPAVTADRVFTFDTNDGHRETRDVYAVDRATGDHEWTAELAVEDGWSLEGHVVAGRDRIFVSALDPHVSMGVDDTDWSGTERLFALDAATGAVEWEWELPRKTLSPPAYADGTLYVGEWYPDADTGRLHAVDATDGSVTWTYRTENDGVRSPTVAGDTVYVAQGEGLAAVAVTDGSRRWRLRIGSRVGSPVVVGDTLYAHTNPDHDTESRLLAVRES
ncbi:PQQ-binding-like beta-propeller repeat protein [Natrinema sp. SYSU A 869]|uniref:outer membrane protein assembly factor BamB family protein n=1 Tax=Natrinema sp. SYSU A 869 TaxID=2871694 RepID=UPI001CA458DD|nr:PQQ-binding-like beta-propeller repeat protein [Natrinema sp. SYSU A 869]